ncbi:hypothetical protein GA0070609_6552 [Micromonospora echinaurantiaca]|uniref:Uncharacterized protein n=1 Tax=Micromonospora echinaurantiaca TaxID=47857 RepID=A0A1C5KDD5_9ACTN|nr:hypothetical protein [Micromonospora echinaurantiaca]SCG80631.1 hypothetical protein GA0070609_6552 [Micromonospora echinaurantiaca]
MNPTQNQHHIPGALADLSPADILRCAARYLELRGWTQGVYYAPSQDDNPFPPACVAGAIAVAVYGHRIPVPHEHKNPAAARGYSRTLDALTCHLDTAGPDPARPYHEGDLDTDPFEWNDRPGRTAEQVISTLRAAADDYDWSHATEDDLETYADACVWAEKRPTREGFLAWLGAR